MRSPEGGPTLRGAGGVVEERSMFHALRVLMLGRLGGLFCFCPVLIVRDEG
jgi:hypothetical protein